MDAEARKGSVLVEAVVCTGLVSCALLLNLEWVRRSYYELAVHHAAFQVARAAVLAPESFPGERASAFWKSCFGRRAADDWMRRSQISVEKTQRHHVARVHVWFGSWLRFPLSRGVKNSFEVTALVDMRKPRMIWARTANFQNL